MSVSDQPPSSEVDRLTALRSVLEALTPLDAESRATVIRSVQTFFRLDSPDSPVGRPWRLAVSAQSSSPDRDEAHFSDDRSSSPKEFLLEKHPLTDVERVACLAYYLTHFRDTPHFKTLDVSKLNTEAAQSKFSNAAVAVNNATKLGYLTQATKSNKQLSAAGEQFVLALPDREAAKSMMARHRKVRRRSKAKVKASAR